MDDFSWWGNWWIKAGLFASLATFGGFLGYVMRSLDKDTPLSWMRAIAEGFAAGFVGLIVLLMCNAMHLGDQWSGVIVGVSGWLGSNATIRVLEKVVFKKLGLRGFTDNAALDGPMDRDFDRMDRDRDPTRTRRPLDRPFPTSQDEMFGREEDASVHTPPPSRRGDRR